MSQNFWKDLEKPIIGMSPMDGVTDAAFRYMVAKYSKPDVLITEFTNVEGLARGAAVMLKAFLYDESERPVVAQIYGVEVDSFYKCSVMLAAMGFDGIDINMGCPANKVAKHGSGASLIQTPKLAKEIVLACKKGVKDWSEGITLEEAGVHENLIAEVKVVGERRIIPVSVKTRIGYREEVAEEWANHLLEVEPDALIMHGRTLKQMYLGKADWDVLSRVAKIVRSADVPFLGNGDVSSMEDASEKCEKYGMDGVLVGRATFGCPWFFGGKEPTMKEQFKIMLEHAQVYEKMDYAPFHNIRKHMAWYCKGFEGAKDLRMELMHAENAGEVEKIIGKIGV